MQEQILAYLSRRAGTPENLARSLGVASDQLNEALDEMEAKGWIGRGAAWFGNDPSTAITVIMLRPAGRKEAERRRILSGEYDVSTCVVVTRDELIAELKRDFEWTDERIAQEPTLRHQRFYFWPAVCGWAGLPDDGNAD